ncbi:MAG: acyltransferase [Cytophagaceae bacterium]|nr:MAG: acyltransferase [Cytophagaceae bacterium]
MFWQAACVIRQARRNRYREMPGKIVSVQYLRAIAALLVLASHALLYPLVGENIAYGRLGWLGVILFFVISGFIIPYSLIGKNYRAHGFFVYIKKRLIRINPPAYAAILLTVGQAFFIDKVIQHSTKYTSSISWMQVLNNFLFTVPFTQYKWLVGVLWTLAIEFQFYLFIGLLFPLLFERQRVWWFVGLYLLLAVGQVVAATSDSFLQYSSLFALGGIALLWQQQRLATWQYGSLLALFTGVIYYQLGIYVAGAGICTAIILNLLTVQVPGLRLLGKISYSF